MTTDLQIAIEKLKESFLDNSNSLFREGMRSRPWTATQCFSMSDEYAAAALVCEEYSKSKNLLKLVQQLKQLNFGLRLVDLKKYITDSAILEEIPAEDECSV